MHIAWKCRFHHPIVWQNKRRGKALNLEWKEVSKHQNTTITGQPSEMRDIRECGWWKLDCVTDPARLALGSILANSSLSHIRIRSAKVFDPFGYAENSRVRIAEGP